MSNDPLADRPFSFQEIKDGRVQLFHSSRLVATLKGRAATKFLARISSSSAAEAQRLMARATGQFKFGNERSPGAGPTH